MTKNIEVLGSEPIKLTSWEAYANARIVKGLNGKDSAIDAGFSEKTAKNKAVELNKIPEIINRMAYLAGKELRKHDLTIDNFVQAIKEHIDFDLTMLYDKNKQLIDLPDLKPEVARCIVGVDVQRKQSIGDLCENCGEEVLMTVDVLKYRIEGKSRYTEQLGKYLQVLKDQVGVETFNELQARATKRGEDIYRQSVENEKKGKTYDHPDIEAEA